MIEDPTTSRVDLDMKSCYRSRESRRRRRRSDLPSWQAAEVITRSVKREGMRREVWRDEESFDLAPYPYSYHGSERNSRLFLMDPSRKRRQLPVGAWNPELNSSRDPI